VLINKSLTREKEVVFMVAIVVDDEELAAEHISRILRKAGFAVYSFTNPYLVLEQDIIRTADIFYLDIEMPEISGLKLAEKIKQVNPECEVVFSTGHNQYAIEAFDVEALDYILKPVTPRQVERSIQRIIKRKGKQVSEYNVREMKRNPLNICLFGKISITSIDGSKNLKISSVKGAEIFCFMLLQRDTAEISKWKLIDELWPDKDINKGDINLRSTISKLNKNFREKEIDISIKSTRNGYQLMLSEDIEVDAFMLESIADKNFIISENNLLSFESTLLKYNDMLFEDFDSEWCNLYRTLYNRYFKIALQKLTNYYKLVKQDPIRILSIMERLIVFEPYDEEVRELCLRLYAFIYGKYEAKKYYEEYCELLFTDLGMKPGEKLRNSYNILTQDI
jgi:two-component SAPR family response regulator